MSQNPKKEKENHMPANLKNLFRKPSFSKSPSSSTKENPIKNSKFLVTGPLPSIQITGDDGIKKDFESKSSKDSVFNQPQEGNNQSNQSQNIEVQKTENESTDANKETASTNGILGYNSMPNLQNFQKSMSLEKQLLKKNFYQNGSSIGSREEDKFERPLPISRSFSQKESRRSSLKQNNLNNSINTVGYNTSRSKTRVSFDTSCLQAPPSRLLSHRLSIESSLGYAETLMHGHYTTAKLKRMIKEERENIEKNKHLDSTKPVSKESCFKRIKKSCKQFFTGYTVQDWAFLTCLGVCAAFLSFLIDLLVEKSLQANRWFYLLAKKTENITYMYFAWITYPLLLVLFSTGFTKLVGPTAIGSGIPEVKTIMKGVVLKEYLTLKTLIAKVFGLISCLGSGLPLGKVGPFVHVASVTSALLSKLFSIFSHIQENECLQIDILTAASAVGVSCTFAAPIGGVLFSVEATATYFAVKNYWRGFYSAMCGALTFRLMTSLFKSEETLTVLFKTDLRQTMPYDIREIFVFISLGLVCGVLGASFVWFHKNIVLLIRRMKKLSEFLQKSRFLYPIIVTLLIFSFTFPPGVGQFSAGQLTLKEAVNQLFDNRTWLLDNSENIEHQRILQIWRGSWDNVLLTISMFFLMKFWMCALAATLPVPCGVFIPSFVLGSALGRFTGELMAWCLPQGIRGKSILPGAYALVGAATFSGAVTHTVSPAVIVFELTGQLAHLLPCVIATMIASAVANFFQPSVYDAMIEIKKLPYLSPIIDSEYCDAYNVTAEDIMDKGIPCIAEKSTIQEIYEIISVGPKYRAYPIVNDKESKVLVGSILRSEAKRMLLRQLMQADLQDSTRLSTDQNILSIEKGNQRLKEPADFTTCTIDPAPFQIFCKTSLFKVHWLFSLLSLHHTIVTDHGTVVGCLSLDEVREAIQRHVNKSSEK